MTKTIYAGFWIRSIAFLIDFVIISIPIFIMLAVIFSKMMAGRVSVEEFLFLGLSNLGLYWVYFGLVVLYFAGFWSWKGATLGKMLLKLRVVNTETLLPPSVGASILRYIGQIISSIPFCLGFFWAIWDKKKQGWHDKLAGTAVIYSRSLETADPVALEVDTRGSGSTKRIFISIAVIIAILLGGLHWYDPLLVSEFFPITHESKLGGDVDKGLAAYESGDYATALSEWRPLAEQGNAEAQGNLGGMYMLGQGVPQDDKTAVKWFTLGAEQGDADAQNGLGWMHHKGQGVPQDDKTALKWFTLAAEQGNAYAQGNLATMYEYGQGVPQDNVHAHMWWSIAASNGLKNVGNLLDKVAKEMTPAQIEKAEKLASECVAKKYKGC